MAKRATATTPPPAAHAATSAERGPPIAVSLAAAARILAAHISQWLIDEQMSHGWQDAHWHLEPLWYGNEWRGEVVVTYTTADGTAGERRHMIEDIPTE